MLRMEWNGMSRTVCYAFRFSPSEANIEKCMYCTAKKLLRLEEWQGNKENEEKECEREEEKQRKNNNKTLYNNTKFC